MPFFESLVQVLPRIKTKLQYSGLVLAVAGFIITRVVAPEALSAQISAGAIGILFIIFGQVFPHLGVIPEQDRSKLILGLFGAFAVFTLALVYLTAHLVNKPTRGQFQLRLEM